jgi:hypothetical protein
MKISKLKMNSSFLEEEICENKIMQPFYGLGHS